MTDPPMYQITASIEVAPREHAKTNFAKQVGSGRSLRAGLHALHADGYHTTVRMPSGLEVPGTMFPPHDHMDDDLGDGPKPEYQHMMHLVEGTWMFRAEPSSE